MRLFLENDVSEIPTDIPSRKKDEDGNFIFDMEIEDVSNSFGYCQIPGKDAFYSTYLFENLLAKQKRMLLKPYPLKQEEQDNG